MTFKVLEGDCAEVLRTLDPESVQTCVTSPPYWGLRDYGHEGQLGLEPTPEEYVANLVNVFGEVKRVLRDDGTLWLNLGDSYAGSWGAQSRDVEREGDKGACEQLGTPDDPAHSLSLSATQIAAHPKGTHTGSWVNGRKDIKPKDLVGIPWMVAFALRADGWYLRSDIIWAKPACMPESVTDRPTKAHEYVFLLSKSATYYYDADAIREPFADERMGASGVRLGVAETYADSAGRGGDQGLKGFNGAERGGRNKRSVWTVSTQPYPGAHFATFPPKLIEPCILAGSRSRDNDGCPECNGTGEHTASCNPCKRCGGSGEIEYRSIRGQYRPCPDCLFTQAAQATVLDPFNGAGTTGLVATRHDRDYIGIELNPEYAQMARDRIYDDAPLLNVEAA